MMRLNIISVIVRYILPLGLFFFLTGILYFSSLSAYHTQIYLFLIIPTFILLLGNWKSYHPLLNSSAFKLLLLLLAYAILSLFWNDPAVNDFKLVKRLLIILLFILALVTIGRDNPERMILIILVAAAVYASAAYYSIYQDYFIQNKSVETRLIGLGNLSNPLLSSHVYGIFTTFLMVYLLITKRSWTKGIGLGVIFLGLISFVLLTGSRTPLLGFGAASMMLLFVYRSKYIFFGIVMLVIAYFFSNNELILQRGMSYRPEIWTLSFEQILMKPLLGYGLGTDIHIESDTLRRIFSDTHNFHIGLTYQLGTVGLLIWISFLVSLLGLYLKNKTSQIAQIGIVLLAYGVSAGMTEGFGFFSRPKEVWFLIWLPIALLFVSEFNRVDRLANN